MTASDSPSYHRTHPERDLISEAIASERRERRLRIVEALASDVAKELLCVDRDRYAEWWPQYRAIVDGLESLIEPTEGQQQ